MEGGEEDQKMKHVCKLCNKSFPCGRSLGGHMRSHVILNSADAEVETDHPNMVENGGGGGGGGDCEIEIDDIDHSAYGLRQNPKKTWRIADSSSNGGLQQQERVCKECGKGFQSLKALCGHMACHSERGKVLNNVEDHSWTSANQNSVMDSQSDTETGVPRRQRRSRRLRYKNLAVDYSSVSVANGSSAVSGIEQEQEEVAMCLMMLSRDSGNWGGFNSVAESSDNNSVVLEARSLSIDMRISKRAGQNCVYNGDETVEMKKVKDRKLKSGAFDATAGIVHFKNSDSGYFRNGTKKVESDVCVDGIFRNGEFKKLKADDHSRFDVSDAELGMGIKRLKKYAKTESVKGWINNDEGYNYEEADRALMKSDSRKRAKPESYSSEVWGVSSKNMAANNGSLDVEICKKKAQKRSKFECFICNKVFHSPQALGGHTASHKKNNGCFASASTHESGENSLETNMSPYQTPDYKLLNDFGSGKNLVIDKKVVGNAEKSSVSKNGKRHECPVCFKVFKSGQALGGHKRIHMAGGSEERINSNPVAKQELNQIPDLLDLNLPPPMKD